MFRPAKLSLTISLVLTAQVAVAGPTHFENFTPILSSVAAGSLPEAMPFLLSSPRFTQKTISANDLGPQNGGVKLGDNWDMNTLNETGPSAGRFLFSPYETGTAGVRRLDRQTGQARTIVAEGAQGFVFGDASRWTPWGTYLTAEESWGANSTKGRLFEVTNPLADPASINFVHRNVIPRVSHEGLAFDKTGAMYFIDELNGGSIYKYVSQTPNASTFFDAGQTFVLKVGAGNNAGATGAAIWVPITDANGAALLNIPTVNINGVISVDGRAAADVPSVGGTAYDRPEDLEIQTLADGSQVLYFAATGTNNVFSIKLTNAGNAIVTLFASRDTLKQGTGSAVATEFTSPDNLAIDAAGNIYIVEDQPGGFADIWLARDADRDGLAEFLGRWATMSTAGAEPTGLYFDPFNANVAYVNIQHANSDIDRTIQITAVPAPETLSLVLGGLALMGRVVRRRSGECSPRSRGVSSLGPEFLRDASRADQHYGYRDGNEGDMKILAEEKLKILAERRGWSVAHAQGYVEGETARRRGDVPSPYRLVGIDDYALGFRAGYFERHNPRATPSAGRRWLTTRLLLDDLRGERPAAAQFHIDR